VRWRHPGSGAAAVDDRRPADEGASARARVDVALRVASRRALFTRDEVFGLLHQVEVAAHDLPVAERVVEIVDEAERETSDHVMCSRAELVDPLLDIRLTLGA
jgi:hypothetical protein